MKHFLRWLVPSAKAIARWERIRQRGLVRFAIVVGISWLVLFLVLMGVLEIVRPVGFFAGLTSAFLIRPLETIGTLLGLGIAFGSLLCLTNEVVYRIARGHIES